MSTRKASDSTLTGKRYNDASAGASKIVDVPDTPTIGTATAGAESATVEYTAALTGGIVTTFTATSSPESITGTGSSPITVSGLTSNTAYTFTVTASNSTGSSSASAASNSITPVAAGDFFSIATVTLSSGAGTVSFTSIPSTYKHLQIRGIAQSNRATYPSDALKLLTVNGSAPAQNTNFWSQNGSSEITNDANGYRISWINSNAQNLSTLFSGFVIDVLDYTNTNKAKTFRAIGGFDANGAAYNPGIIGFSGTLWNSTSAITSLEFSPGEGSQFNTGSQFALYGIKG